MSINLLSFLVKLNFEREVAEANIPYTNANPHFQLGTFHQLQF